MKTCAQNPVEGVSAGTYEQYGCRKYDAPDAQAFLGNDDNAKEQNALICVRDKCLNTGTPPCHQCAVSVQKSSGTAGGYASLEDSKCGQCIRNACGALLVKCCDSNIPDGLEKCGYTDNPDYKNDCYAAVHRDAGGPDAAPSYFGAEWCTWKFAQSCLPSCYADCQ
jgi:hypothetical protein